MFRETHDYFGTLEVVLSYHLHKELQYLKAALLDPHFYPQSFHTYLQSPELWEVSIDPATAALIHFNVRLSLLGRQRTFKPDLVLYNTEKGFLIPIEIETICSRQTIAQMLVYTGLSSYTALQLVPTSQLATEISAAVSSFVIFLRSPPSITHTLRFYHFRLVTLLTPTDDYEHFLKFPKNSPIGLLQQLVQYEDLQLLYHVATASDLTALNKIFILQNLLVHGSEKMTHSIKELEHKGILDLKTLEKEAVHELPPEYMRYFTPEQLRGLTPEQLRGLSPEQLRGLTPEQLRGLSPEQLRGLTPEQLRGLTPKQLRGLTPKQLRGLTPKQLINLFTDLAEHDPETLRIIIKQIPKKVKNLLLQLLTEEQHEED